MDIATVSSLTIVLVLVLSGVRSQNRVFEVDYEHDQFLKDGKPFRYVAGSLHYFRVPRAYWQDRLRKFRAAGLNAVSVYVEWSLHEPKRGIYDFTGDKDIEHFIRLAEQEDLLVILRPGPYICAERDLGGYPAWLLHENPKMKLRTNDTSHTEHVQTWLDTLLPRLQHLLYGNGGPIIMVQVENEYGSYPICDKAYTLWLRDLFRKHIGTKAVLFTTDGAGRTYLKCGPIPGVFVTVDFGSVKNVTKLFSPLKEVQPHGPQVNSEFYPGWLTHWGESLSSVNTAEVVKTTRDLLAANASFNYYVFFGGTNFGFTSGANTAAKNQYLPQLTSYDYDAPITEGGDLTNKYFAIKSVISEFMSVPNIAVENSTTFNYGTVTLEPKTSLFESNVGITYDNSVYPKTFEELELYSGFLLYETSFPKNFSGKGLLVAKNVHDRAIVYVNKKPAGVFDRNNAINSVVVFGEEGQPIGLLVENQGHINYGLMSDLKGLTENVTLSGNILSDWKQTGYPLDDVSHIADLPTMGEVHLPAFYSGKFQLPKDLEEPRDTYINMMGWTKGVVYVNGHNLGRYWPVKGPQLSLYLPAPFLLKHPEYNSLVVMELEKENHARSIAFSATSVWSK